MSREAWLRAHSYLQPVAQLCAQVDSAAAGLELPAPRAACWDDYRGDFDAGVPLLRSSSADLDLEPAGRAVVSLVGRLAAEPPSGQWTGELRSLEDDLRREADPGRRVIDWLLGDDSFSPSSAGLLRYLGWTVMARYLIPVVDAFAGWRNDERWLRRYCPTCGSSPAMAQLVGTDPGRKRLLSCGCCGTRWQYKRMGCPFCETDSQRMAAVIVEGEAGLRIDHCDSCGGYLKTYDGEGQEALLLSDWTSLHLDILAQDRGLRRLAASLFELPPAPQGGGANSGNLFPAGA